MLSGVTSRYQCAINYYGALYLLPLILLPFTPFYAYMMGVFVMVLFSAHISTNFRILLGCTLCLSIAIIYSSRLYCNLATDFDDDFSRYYQNYLDVYDGLSGSMAQWGNGYEIGLPIFYKLLALFLPKLPPQYVLFSTALCATILMYVWLEKYGVKFVKQDQRAALIAFSVSIFAFLSTLGLTRQCFASLFLLYMFFAKPPYVKLLFFIIASGFHLSSIPIAIMCYILYYFPRLSFVVFASFFGLFVVSSAYINTHVTNIADMLHHIVANRIIDYVRYYINASGYNPYYLIYTNIMKSIIMCCVVFVLFVLAPNDRILKRFKVLILITFTIYVTNCIPGRATMLLGDTMFFFIVFVVFRRFFTLTLLFFFPYFLKLMYGLLISGDHPDTRSLELFFSFPESSLYPFYYFFQGALL